jgi:hypothetical protein
MIPERLQNMLASEDKELVQLGATLLSDLKPKGYWHRYLDQHVENFDWDIIGDEIYIKEIRHTRIVTGAGGMKLFNQAMQKWGQKIK